MTTEIRDWTDLPDELPSESDEGWSFGCGGHGLPDNQWCISYVDEELNEIRYKLPLFISYMMDTNARWAKEELQREMKNLLGIHSC